MQPTTRSSNQPLGGSSGDWRHRLLRFHVPLALASVLVLLVFITLPLFTAIVPPHVDLVSGPFPQARSMGEPSAPMAALHSQIGSPSHGGSQAGSMDHAGNQTGSTNHGGNQTGSMSPDEMKKMREQQDQAGSQSFMRQLTVGTGYLALGLLGLTLLIGPANLLLRKRNPVSSYLRRDVGMWTATFSIAHVIFGFQLHGTGKPGPLLDYFFAPDGSPLGNSFGLGNWTGLAATVIVVGLLALSSDAALRKLKAGPWKWLQRLNYALFALVIAHAFFYGALLRTTSPFTLLLILIVIAVFVGQALGIWLWRRQHARTTASQA